MAGRVRAGEAGDESFSALAEALLADPAVSEGRMFGSPGLKVRGKVFAMLVRGSLVVKLPRERVETLVAAGVAAAFDPGHGRLMKEWIAVAPAAAVDWRALASEARRYVEAGS